jgi:type IV pilus assembly protein PilY1
MAGSPSCLRASTTPMPRKRAALFLLSLDKPAGEAWKQNSNYLQDRLAAPEGQGHRERLGHVPGDYAAADGPRALYAGDTQGNLWKFDFTGNAPWAATASWV